MAEPAGRRARAVGLPALAALALALAACTAVPDSGPIHAGQQPPPAAAPNVVHVNPRGPVTGSQPDTIVTGFRFANSDTTQALGTAKSYLVDGASWQPSGAKVVADSGATLTDVSSAANAVTVKVVDNQIGVIAADGTYQPTPSAPPITYNYQLTKDPKQGDQWRITNAPAYLVLTVAQIESSYQEGYVYFLRPDEQMLVPVQVFLPVSRDQLAQELLTTLLDGPPAWLKPAVTTALLGGNAPGPTQINGVTTVDLPRGAATLPAAQRNAMAAQITYTLSNVATPSQNFGELKILTGGQPLINTQALALQTAANWASFDPDALSVNFYYSDNSHQTRDHSGRLIAGDTGELDITPLLAPAIAPRASSAAANQLIAGVVQNADGTYSLYAGSLLAPKPLLTGSNFTTPSWDSLGNLWTVQQQNSSAPRVRIAPSGKATLPGSVATPDLPKSVIDELKVSRDGTRIAALVVSTNVSQVMVGAVSKDGTSIVNFYPVAPTLTSVTDFVWASSTKLDILDTVPNTNEPGSTSQLWSVDVDGWAPSLTQGTTVPATTVSIAAAPRQPLVVGTSLNQIEQYSNGQWQFIGNGSSPRYPG